jgi:hypothetical protein
MKLTPEITTSQDMHIIGYVRLNWKSPFGLGNEGVSTRLACGRPSPGGLYSTRLAYISEAYIVSPSCSVLYLAPPN